MLTKTKNTSVKAGLSSLSFSKRVILYGIIAAFILTPATSIIAQAVTCKTSSDCRAQISDLRDTNASAQSSLDNLIAQAGSYQAAIGALQSQIDSVTAVIHANEQKQADIQAQIVQKQAELDHQRKILAADVKAIYVDGQMTTIEMLATSKNLSDYVDKEEYRETVQNKIRDTMSQIVALQKQLQQQKAEIDSLLVSQKQQESELAAARAKQAGLLAMNQSQQANFNTQIKANNAQIASLQRQQAAMNAVGSSAVFVAASGGSGGACDNGGGNGGYPMPWCNAPKDSVTTSFHPSPGNYTNRECTSFAYWYFTSVLGHGDFRVGYGDAKTWTYNSNYPLHSTPVANSIGVKDTGTYGHVLIVKATPGQTFGGVSVPAGRVLVYEMNSDFSGHFRAALRDINTFAGFLY
jgi:surface antigen/peptidoglycan hydrolase CwlO-like protein